jgi:hypothetical protein
VLEVGVEVELEFALLRSACLVNARHEATEVQPPDVEELGRSTWTLLHSMAATYPEKADAEHQANIVLEVGVEVELEFALLRSACLVNARHEATEVQVRQL